MKKCIITILIIIVLISNIAFSEDVTSTDVTVIVDGSTLDSIDAEQGVNLPPIIYNNRTMIPLKKMFEAFGIASSQITWDGDERSVEVITNNNDYIWMQIDNPVIFFNEKELKTDVPAKIYKNRTYIPLSMVSSLLGTVPEWHGETRTVTVNPSTYVLSRYNVSFEYPRREGYVLTDDFEESNVFYFSKTAISTNETLSMLIIEKLNKPINNVFEDYLINNFLNSDDFMFLSRTNESYIREEDGISISFVKVGLNTLKITSNGISVNALTKILDSIREVK